MRVHRSLPGNGSSELGSLLGLASHESVEGVWHIAGKLAVVAWIGLSGLGLLAETPAAVKASEHVADSAHGSVMQGVKQPAVTLAIFPDRPMPEGLMTNLIAALEREEGSTEATVLFDSMRRTAGGVDAAQPRVQILSGDQVTAGVVVENSISVYVHGECKPEPRAPEFIASMPPVTGALGWVTSDGGHIQPFVHVECGRIAAMLAGPVYGRSREERNAMMAQAMSRVIVHEWMHVATQSPHHAQEGVGKAAFGVKDLLGGPVWGTGRVHGKAVGVPPLSPSYVPASPLPRATR